MSGQELQRFLTTIRTNYPSKPIDEKEWQLYLEDYTAQNCDYALREWKYNNKFAPRPADIAELCEGIIYRIKNPLYDLFEVVSMTANNFNNPQVKDWIWKKQKLYQQRQQNAGNH